MTLPTDTTAPKRYIIDDPDAYHDCAVSYTFASENARRLVELHLAEELEAGALLGAVVPDCEHGTLWYFKATPEDLAKRESYVREKVRQENRQQLEALEEELRNRRYDDKARWVGGGQFEAELERLRKPLAEKQAAEFDATVADRMATPPAWEFVSAGPYEADWRDAATGGTFRTNRSHVGVAVVTGAVDIETVSSHCVLVTDAKLREYDDACLRRKRVTAVNLGEAFRKVAIERGVLREETPIAVLPEI